MGTTLLWVGFNAFVLAAIALDLGVFHRRSHQISMKEAGVWSAAWVALTLMCGAGVFFYAGRHLAVQFFTAYLVEKALSVDNLFLFLVIFRTFGIDQRLQHRVLEWGIVGALVLRGLMIFAGVELIERFSWVLYVLGAFLLYAGIHLLFVKKEKIRPQDNVLVRFAQKHLRVWQESAGERFFVRRDGKFYVTPLFLVLLVVEITDISLAVDSIPAVFGITQNPFIVYTSNVFAILGLRAMYFLLAGVLNRLRYLTVGLSGVLLFIGGKMIAGAWIDIPDHIALAVVAGILLVAVAASLLFPAEAKTKD